MEAIMISMRGAVDVHFHTYPCLFPRIGDDVTVAQNARDLGMRAILIKCHHESTVSRAYLTRKLVPGLEIFGGLVLNSYVGGINPAAVEAALKLGAKQIWMPTIDAAFHGKMHGRTGGYDVQSGGRDAGPGISVLDESGKLRPEVIEVLDLIAQYNVILGTAHLSPQEIVTLVPEARRRGVEKILITHPFFKVPGLDMETLESLVRQGAIAEFGYCTVSPMWAYATVKQVAAAIRRLGASNCILMSDTGQRHNPLPGEALRIFAQNIFEAGIPEEDVYTMIVKNPCYLLDLDPAVPSERELPKAEAV